MRKEKEEAQKLQKKSEIVEALYNSQRRRAERVGDKIIEYYPHLTQYPYVAIVEDLCTLLIFGVSVGHELTDKLLQYETKKLKPNEEQTFKEEFQALFSTGEYQDKVQEADKTFELFESLLKENQLQYPKTLEEISQMAMKTFIDKRANRVKIQRLPSEIKGEIKLSGTEQAMAILLIRTEIARVLKYAPLDANVTITIKNNNVGISGQVLEKSHYNPWGFGVEQELEGVKYLDERIEEITTKMKIGYARTKDPDNPEYFISGFNFAPQSAQDEKRTD